MNSKNDSDERAELSARPVDTTAPPAWANERELADHLKFNHDWDIDGGEGPSALLAMHTLAHEAMQNRGETGHEHRGDDKHDDPKLTETSLALFLAYARDAGNWGGTPLVGGNVCISGEREDRGNLTQLKRAGLVATFAESGATWLNFTDAGRRLAAKHGIDVSWTA